LGNSKTTLSSAFWKPVTAVDALVIVFYSLLTLLALVFSGRIDGAFTVILYNLAFIGFLLFLTRTAARSRVGRILHFWYPLPMIVITYKEMHLLVHSIRSVLFDDVLIRIDRFLFGVDPTAFLSRFANPVLTEILQIIYIAFYLLPILLGMAMLRRGRTRSYDFTVFLVLYGFFLSYLGYVVFPAIGPRFTLHDFLRTDQELPGLFLTPYLREFVNLGESISSGMPDAALYVQRDVFPSGHTLVTLITIYLSIRLRTRACYFLIPVGLVLIFSTVYLRYHYVADLLGAFVFFLFAVATGRGLFNFWEKLNGRGPYAFLD
jgi:hypothetical protein